MAGMVAKNVVVYEPPKQTHAVMLYWCLLEEWADFLHSWETPENALLFCLLSQGSPLPSNFHSPARTHKNADLLNLEIRIFEGASGID
ncbi:hypothetical protein AZE42_09452 [Rhizopogon vesiculosus]|uniref:Uncharacterized protein n=1 Tax=Rhizopogon vesiculosus TaxID=180088 RepID=A0A1J8Q7E2_9AGAM|nr:hypothetical protein AZE42_09452 [Rhizopogon vesiculosus]